MVQTASSPFSDVAWRGCFRQMETILGRSLSSQHCLDLQRFSQLLLQANRRINLMGPSAEKDLLSRHMLDSVPLLPLIAQEKRIADIGSGGGFPGIVVAILLQPPCTIHLIESVSKKASFLQYVVVELGLQERVQVSAQRVEQLGEADGHNYDVVVSRALGSLTYGAKLAQRLLRPGGYYLALKGQKHKVELEDFGHDPVECLFQKPEVYPTVAKGGGVIIRLPIKTAE